MEAVRHIRLATCGATLGSPMLPTHRGQDTENVPSRGKASRPVLSSTLERARTENQRVAKAERALWARGGGGARITTLTRVGPLPILPAPGGHLQGTRSSRGEGHEPRISCARDASGVDDRSAVRLHGRSRSGGGGPTPQTERGRPWPGPGSETGAPQHPEPYPARPA